MSLTVKHLNADATFLLTFAPSFAPSDTKRKFPGSFSILIDPWLDGDSVIYHPKFANSRLRTTPSIKTLAELEDEVDLIIISQEKADHLSRKTLCTLPKDTNIKILATAKAVKKIREWKHFEDPGVIQPMKPYESEVGNTIIRIPLEPYSSASADGEITITNISEKRDITGLHNAIGITYCPPGTVLTAWDGSAMKLENMPVLSMSETSKLPETARQTKYRDVRGRPQERDFVRPNLPTVQSEDSASPLPPFAPLLRVDSHARPSTSGSRAPDIKTIAKRPDNHEDVISVIYTPHGLDAASLKPYLDNHLSKLKHALPVTALFHSFNTEANPWWLGGVVSKGAPGGIGVSKAVEAKYWISAHDDMKELKGFATKWTKSRKYDAEEVREMVGGTSEDWRDEGRKGTEVCVVGCGEVRRFT